MMYHQLVSDNPFLDPTWKACRMVKAEREFFHSEEFCYHMGLTPQNREMLQSHFEVALDAIVGCLSPDDLPDYATIRSHLQSALEISKL